MPTRAFARPSVRPRRPTATVPSRRRALTILLDLAALQNALRDLGPEWDSQDVGLLEDTMRAGTFRNLWPLGALPASDRALRDVTDLEAQFDDRWMVDPEVSRPVRPLLAAMHAACVEQTAVLARLGLRSTTTGAPAPTLPLGQDDGELARRRAQIAAIRDDLDALCGMGRRLGVYGFTWDGHWSPASPRCWHAVLPHLAPMHIRPLVYALHDPPTPDPALRRGTVAALAGLLEALPPAAWTTFPVSDLEALLGSGDARVRLAAVTLGLPARSHRSRRR